MTYAITKTFTFAAAHHLPQLPDGHKCRRPHGHNYAVTLVLEADHLDPCGMVTDYGDLDPVKQWIATDLDHRDLNEVLPCLPTAEWLARAVWDRWTKRYPELAEVIVSETPATTASYRP